MISAVVPTFRGRARLERHLGSVAASLEAAGEPWEIVVVDDGGGDVGTLPAGARLVARERNGGYGPAVNAGARDARGDHLLILNDDVALEPATVATLRRQFPDPALFAAVPSILSPLVPCGDEGGRGGRWEAGLIALVDVPSDVRHPSLYPVGCCFLCPRGAFLELGGYDESFAPFFWEDVDLGYRAWRRGLATLHVPEAVCRHEGSATLRENYGPDEREQVSFRNAVLFHLLNLQDPARRAENLGAWAAYALFETRPERRRALAEALDRYEELAPREPGGLSDAAILERVTAS